MNLNLAIPIRSIVRDEEILRGENTVLVLQSSGFSLRLHMFRASESIALGMLKEFCLPFVLFVFWPALRDVSASAGCFCCDAAIGRGGKFKKDGSVRPGKGGLDPLGPWNVMASGAGVCCWPCATTTTEAMTINALHISKKKTFIKHKNLYHCSAEYAIP